MVEEIVFPDEEQTRIGRKFQDNVLSCLGTVHWCRAGKYIIYELL